MSRAKPKKEVSPIYAGEFEEIAKYLEEHPKAKRELAKYMTNRLAEHGELRVIRVNEVTRWLHPDKNQRSEPYWSRGKMIKDWYLEHATNEA